jgi:uncharacterized protein (DUF1684 family)
MSNTTRIALGIGMIIIIILSIYMLMLSTGTADYRNEILGQRTTKDVWLSNDFDSPFVKTNTPFQRLKYFPPNQEFIIAAKFIKNNNSDSVNLITNMGEAQTYLIYGTASFSFNGIGCTLQILQPASGGELFVPFIDATSGNSSYGAGRYLPADLPIADEISLDFNKAYNPYCAYVDGFSCPFPPKANILKVAIEAGEKTYH